MWCMCQLCSLTAYIVFAQSGLALKTAPRTSTCPCFNSHLINKKELYEMLICRGNEHIWTLSPIYIEIEIVRWIKKKTIKTLSACPEAVAFCANNIGFCLWASSQTKAYIIITSPVGTLATQKEPPRLQSRLAAKACKNQENHHAAQDYELWIMNCKIDPRLLSLVHCLLSIIGFLCFSFLLFKPLGCFRYVCQRGQVYLESLTDRLKTNEWNS